MDERLRRLQRLNGAMQTRKHAYEMRLAQIQSRIGRLTAEREQLLADSAGTELFPGASLHYVKRLEGIEQQLRSQRKDADQLRLLQMKAGVDLRRSEISLQAEADAVQRLREARYLEQVIDTSLFRRLD